MVQMVMPRFRSNADARKRLSVAFGSDDRCNCGHPTCAVSAPSFFILCRLFFRALPARVANVNARAILLRLRGAGFSRRVIETSESKQPKHDPAKQHQPS